ncbi:MAG TPA: hypothetical protein VFF79_08220 [Conexibacter sp.]|nr:hypothetical protein [Conexibacter sp.]
MASAAAGMRQRARRASSRTTASASTKISQLAMLASASVPAEVASTFASARCSRWLTTLPTLVFAPGTDSAAIAAASTAAADDQPRSP